MMKKILMLSVVLAAALAFALPAQAALLWYEGIDYEVGAIAGQGGWTADSVGAIASSPGLTIPGVVSNGVKLKAESGLKSETSVPEAVSHIWTDYGTYYITLMHNPHGQGNTHAWLHGLDGSDIYIGHHEGHAQLYYTGLGDVESTNQDYELYQRFVAIRMINQVGDDRMDMVVTQDMSGGEPDWDTESSITVTGGDLTGTTNGELYMDFGTTGTGKPHPFWDEFRVATTWAEAVGIPEPATCGLLMLGALALMLVRRKRR